MLNKYGASILISENLVLADGSKGNTCKYEEQKDRRDKREKAQKELDELMDSDELVDSV